MNEKIITGTIFALGGLAFVGWGFFDAWSQTRLTPQKEKFDGVKAAKIVVPTLAASFLAGYNMTPSTAIDYVGLVFGGFGFAAAYHKGQKLVVDNFFTEG